MEATAALEPRWIEPDAPPAAEVDRLAGTLGLPPEVCGLLIARGHRSPEAVRRFLRPSFDQLHPVEDLPDARRAARRLLAAVAEGETVLVHGDYDADGLCAAAVLARGLTRLGARIETFVPHRIRDGYDLGPAGLARADEVDAGLIVTADCGVSAAEAVEEARRAGRDVVVTDHHSPPERLPEAAAIVHPGRRDGAYPFPDLAGVGVAFKLLTAAWSEAGRDRSELNELLDLVALGTVADVVPLRDENRVLVRGGLRALERSRKPGVRALKERAGLAESDPVGAGQVAWRLGPRLNAAGRIGEPEDAVRLLTTEDAATAARLADELERCNERRREEGRAVREAAEAEAAQRFDPDRDRSLVVWGDGWHPGVLGIVAGRLVEQFHRPVAVIGLEGERGRGSARSVPAFHLHRALEECAGTLERFGGHAGAAGFEIRREEVARFAARFEDVARRELDEDRLRPELRVDLEIPLSRADRELHDLLRHMAPFGAGNPRPVLASPGVRLSGVSRVGDDGAHLRARLAGGGAELQAIGFGMGERAERLTPESRWDVAYQLVEDRWKGRSRLQARLRGLRPAD